MVKAKEVDLYSVYIDTIFAAEYLQDCIDDMQFTIKEMKSTKRKLDRRVKKMEEEYKRTHNGRSPTPVITK